MSDHKSEQSHLEWKICRIEIPAVEIIPLNGRSLPADIRFSLSMKYSVNSGNNVVSVDVSTVVHGDSLDDAYARVKTAVSFQLKELSPHILINTETNALSMHPQFLLTINSISISTTRGLLFNVLRGTYLENAYLPLINPSSIITSQNIDT